MGEHSKINKKINIQKCQMCFYMPESNREYFKTTPFAIAPKYIK